MVKTVKPIPLNEARFGEHYAIDRVPVLSLSSCQVRV